MKKNAKKSSEPDTGFSDMAKIADGLADVLGDTYVLTIKTHACHWNVVGPQFYSIHKLTEDQYGDLFAAADELAERIRALGHFAPANMKALADHAAMSEGKESPDAEELVEGLVASHENISRRLHDLISVAEKGGDAVTADLATERAAFHEKAAWMLRAMVAG
ncbi:DNA starvation/stationary phase protection protein [Pikeienuella piscinae]|uniref:DNA starvation/stationary phase protection protein n=1 Tax=Pikeienuella piscinae TaxID=2748098 RepID=A0A7L5BW79_9RHOB|nr:DNA starvation/stationary phase protection protein [Pikeienuella piscinae]QIE55691.1 DNA starvation/stationary phase protection protein [Pikeienuella piscinae]